MGQDKIMDVNKIRNFCIIAHIDHGKSTLADRLMEYTNTVAKRAMKEQMLDQLDLERERGITIKLAPVAMDYKGYLLNLIDTPGHVDFSYEVSRSLACVEGAILLVDASQGIQAQTLANLHMAKASGLKIIPAINKIDLPNALVEETIKELSQLLEVPEDTVLKISGKTGAGVTELLDRIITDVPAARIKQENLQALIFDSEFNEFRGVIASVRVVAGELKSADRFWLPGGNVSGEVLEVGVYKPSRVATPSLQAGQIGYVVTGLKNIADVRVGDTVLTKKGDQALPGYQEFKPMVYAGFYPKEGYSAKELREGLEKLKLNDASLYIEPEHSPALGYGFRIGFLGLLHLEITKERLRREHKLELVITSPSVAYRVTSASGEVKIIKSAVEFDSGHLYREVDEPVMSLDIVSPNEYLGKIMELSQKSRALWTNTDYLTGADGLPERAILHYEIPLATILFDYYDNLKSVSQGYASLNYDFLEYRPCKIKKLNILVAEEEVEALSTLVYEDEAYYKGRAIVSKLKDIIPKQMFEIKIQAALGGKVIASERISAMRKDVLKRANSGGDVTRKMKLLEKQKKGKKRMKASGHVNIPTEAYLSLLNKSETKEGLGQR